jgi:gamma-tubulin complex component 5
MAQSARIGALTDELVTSITSFSPSTNAQAFKHAKDAASRGLRGYQYARTNQFDVRAKLDGFDEKFRVLNRNDLANALLERLKELDKVSNKWTPETLSLLLQLSDRPVEKSNVDDLDQLKPPRSPPPLTWAEIIADDPLDEEGVWESIDYAAESSEDEANYRTQNAKVPELTPDSSISEEDLQVDPDAYVIRVHDAALSEIRNRQFWNDGREDQADTSTKEGSSKPTGHREEITELQIIREVLFMLAGLPTSLYSTDTTLNEFKVNKAFGSGHATAVSLNDVLSNLGEIGSQVYRLRKWTGNKPPIPLFQTFEAAVVKRLSEFDRNLAGLQSRYLCPSTPIVVSLLEVHDEVRRVSGPVLQLAALVVAVMPSLSGNPFLHLEALFDHTSLAQMSGDAELFLFFAEMFLDCLQPYLKPIKTWTEQGELGPDDETFFVFTNDKSSDVASLWHDKFAIRRRPNGDLHAPRFLRPAARRIFNTGKSIVFLKELGTHHTYTQSTGAEPRLDFETICGEDGSFTFSPFSELFDSAFETWVSSKFNLASTILRQKLSSECGLWDVLDTFRIVYLSADGSLFQDFADLVFERMDELDSNWNDRYLLTELVHGIYGSVLAPGHAERLVVRKSTTKRRSRSVKNLAAVSIDYNVCTISHHQRHCQLIESDTVVNCQYHPEVFRTDLPTHIRLSPEDLSCQIPSTESDLEEYRGP